MARMVLADSTLARVLSLTPSVNARLATYIGSFGFTLAIT
jgi:hypothetical protein